MADESLVLNSPFYRVVDHNGGNLLACSEGANAKVVPKLDLGEIGVKNQSWQFIKIFGEVNTYYLRNDDDVYLQVDGTDVVGGNKSTATLWEKIPQPVSNYCKLKVSGIDSYIGKSLNSLNLDNDTHAVVWDVQVQDQYPS